MEMRRYIVLLLITGIVWAQTDFDKLILKDGTTYFGEYSKTEGDRVYFKPHDAFGFQPITFNTIHKLELANGLKLVTNGKIEQDRLVLKDGTRYLGEFSTIDGENVLFKPEGAFGFQPISVKRIKNLQLKDGRFIIGKYKRELTTKSTGVNKLTRNEKVVVGCLLIAVVIYFTIKGKGYSANDSPGLGCGCPCGQCNVDLP